jgi:hypothetical protein
MEHTLNLINDYGRLRGEGLGYAQPGNPNQWALAHPAS